MRTVNPVLKREVVERWRSRRAPMTLTVYLTILGSIMYLLYRGGTSILRASFGFGLDASAMGPALGRFLVEGLFFFVLLLVLFVGPGYAAAQISGERERRTLTLLQVTLLRPVQIVLGKLGAATAWLALLVLAAVPLGAVAFFLGGVGITDLLRGGLMLLVLAVSVSAISLGISSMTKRTTGSIVLTYGTILALTLGTLFLAGAEALFRSTRNEQVRTPIAMYLNPFFGLADAVNASRTSSGPGLPSPLGVLAELMPGAPAMGGGFEDEAFVEGGGGVVEFEGEMRAEVVPPGPPVPLEEDLDAAGDGGPLIDEPGVPPPAIVAEPVPALVPEQRDNEERPVWLIVMALYLLMGLLGLLIATRRLRITEPRAGRGGTPPPPRADSPAAPAAPGPAPAVSSQGWDAGS